MRLPHTVTAAVRLRAPRGSASVGGGLRIFASRRVRLLRIAAVLVALGLGAGLSVGIRGLASDEASVAPQLRSLAERAGPLVVFSEFGEVADTIWAANPRDPAQRLRLGQVDHALGYGIFPALSPDGGRIAYTALPRETARPTSASPAELWVLDLGAGESRRLAEGVDLLAAPRWSAQADALVVRRAAWREDGSVSSELLRIDLDASALSLAAVEGALFPIDFSPDGASLYYAVVTAAGTDLLRTPAQGGDPERIAHVSDGIARDWQLSPDGSQVAYSAQAPGDAEAAFVVQILDLQTGGVRAPLVDEGSLGFNPIWHENGVLTIGRIGSGGAGLALEGGLGALEAAPLPGRAGGHGFDMPLSWSPDGSHLAVRSFEGASVADPGPSRVVLLGTDGGRRELSGISDIRIAGWLEALP